MFNHAYSRKAIGDVGERRALMAATDTYNSVKAAMVGAKPLKEYKYELPSGFVS